jgi:uncharacterized membrane protein
VARRARQGLTLAWSPAQYARVMKSGSPPQVREPGTTAFRSFTRPMIALVVLVLGGVGVVVYRAEASIQNGSASLDAVAWTSAVAFVFGAAFFFWGTSYMTPVRRLQKNIARSAVNQRVLAIASTAAAVALLSLTGAWVVGVWAALAGYVVGFAGVAVFRTVHGRRI